MADKTGIQWCDATFNPWIGCEKVSPGCAHCYAETLVVNRMGRAAAWGADGERKPTVEANWSKPLRWAQRARDGKLPDGTPNVDGHRPRIFCASLADVFEERPELDEHRERLFRLIRSTPELDWLILTKRPAFARTWLDRWYAWPTTHLAPPHDVVQPPLPNVWMGVSIENARFTWRADVLREIPAAVRFISAEPLLGSLFRDHDGEHFSAFVDDVDRGRAPLDLAGIDWIIVGGESGPGARPFHLEHAREIISAAMQPCLPCRSGAHETHFPREFASDLHANERPAVFVKQLGAKPIDSVRRGIQEGRENPLPMLDRKGGDWAEWPADLRIREFPRSAA